MQDRVPLYPGRVTLTPVAGQANTYDMARADQPTQEGTPLNKANLLSDQVASLIGLTSSAVPNDMFNVLATVGDLHVWRRTTSSGTDYPVSVNPNAYQTGSDAKPAGYTLGDKQSQQIFARDQEGKLVNCYTADSIVVRNDGTIDLSQFQTRQLIYIRSSGASSAKSVLAGKFFILRKSDPGTKSDLLEDTVYFAPSDVEFSYTPYQPSGRIDPTLYITNLQSVTGYPATPAGTTIEYMGKLGDKSRIVTGSYVGTGTYGQSNPNKLIFDSTPGLVVVMGNENNANNDGRVLLFWVNGVTGVSDGYSRVFSFDESSNILSWHSPSFIYQLNESGLTYNYTSILL